MHAYLLQCARPFYCSPCDFMLFQVSFFLIFYFNLCFAFSGFMLFLNKEKEEDNFLHVAQCVAVAWSCSCCWLLLFGAGNKRMFFCYWLIKFLLDECVWRLTVEQCVCVPMCWLRWTGTSNCGRNSK